MRYTCCMDATIRRFLGYSHEARRWWISRKLFSVNIVLTTALADSLAAQTTGGTLLVGVVLGEWLWLVLALLAVLVTALYWRSITQTRSRDNQRIPLIFDLDALPRASGNVPAPVLDAPPRNPVSEHRVAEPPSLPSPPTEPTFTRKKPESSDGDDELTVFVDSSEVPLEILPGRLEILEDGQAVRDIQFIRTMSGPLEFTIGRSQGPPDRHIRLDAPTVSRLHAQMRLDRGKGWLIANRSETNPVRLNGQEVATAPDYQALSDGDLIQIGQFHLRFRK